jgi:hypothetical protein
MDNNIKVVIAEKNAMELSIYLASRDANRNLRIDNSGNEVQDFFINWIDAHAEKFRQAWEESLCKCCEKIENCHLCLKKECNNFSNEK